MQEKFTLNRFPSSHIIQEVSNGYTGREVNPTPVSTPALMPAKKGSAVIPKSVISTLVFAKSSNVPRFCKLPVNTEASGLQMPSSPVGAQETGCPLGFGLSCVWRRLLARGGLALGACGRDGSREDSSWAGSREGS